MQPNPLISVIITTFKRPNFLLKTLKSILSQTYSNLEIIIVDDGSKDSTEEIVKSFCDSRIKFFSIEASGRPAIPRNFGLINATGELIAFCDDDDLWELEKIAEQVNVFIKHPEIKLCHTNIVIINEKDEELNNKNNKQHFNPNKINFNSQLLKNDITFSTVMIHKSVLLNGMKFDESLDLKASEDYLFLTNIVYFYPINYIEKKLVKYRIHKNGISYSYNSTKKLLLYYYRTIICMYKFFELKQISLLKFLFLVKFHFIHVIKQVLFSYYYKLKKYWSVNV
jgi:glycosyltransferase involved in cell wall biosynthesis